jgi:DNA polymerase-1
VSIYHPQKRTVLREADVVAAFGVPPARVPDVQALAGDPADGLAGAPGIGRKIGADLIRRFGDLEALLARLDEVPQSKRRARLRESADSVRLTRRLVALDAQAPRPLPLEALRRRPLDRDAVQGFLARTGIEVTLPAT